MISSIIYGNMKETSYYNVELLNEIEQSPNKQVIIYDSGIKSDECFTSLGLNSDKNHWINKAVAEYYKKDSIEVIYEK